MPYFFMDTSSGYTQIQMALQDCAKTSFITLWGTFFYKVMPFEDEQHTKTALFQDMTKENGRIMGDMVAKSKAKEDHLVALWKIFERLRKYNLKLNQTNVFLVRHRANYWASS